VVCLFVCPQTKDVEKVQRRCEMFKVKRNIYKLAAKKIVSITIVCIFLASSVLPNGWAVTDIGGAPYVMKDIVDLYSQYAVLDTATFTVPEHLGEVRFSYKGNSDKVIVHIQDAHCNIAAQHKVADLIDYINKEYGVELINLEGGAGKYDLETFTSVTGRDIRRELAEYFMKKGQLNGAEFYAINNPDRSDLWGVENKELYLANLKVYRDSLSYKQEVEQSLKELTHILNNLKRDIYTPGLLKVDMAHNAYKAGNMDFKDYLEFLMAQAKDRLMQVKQYPNLYLISQAIEEEGTVDFKRANIERNVLIDELKKGLSKQEIRELVSKTVGFRTKRVSRRAFYRYLVTKAKAIGVDTEKFPALSKYIVYVSLFEAVDQTKVMAELDAIEAAVKDTEYKNDTQRELNILSINLAILKNIFAIQLTKNDYNYFLQNRDSFRTENFKDFIEREAPKYKITARPGDGFDRLDDHLDSISKFYEYSFKRDLVFLENLKFDDASGNKKVAVIMTGGFHTENLCDLFKEQDISYVSVLPKFTTPKEFENPYFDLLAGQTEDVQRMLRSAIAKASAMQIASMMTSLGEDVWGEADIDAFKVERYLMEQVLQGTTVTLTDIPGIGEQTFKSREGGPSVTMSFNRLLHAVHDIEIDQPIKKAMETDGMHAKVDAAVRNNAAARLRLIAEQSGDQHQSILMRLADMIEKGELAINLVDIGDLALDGHAGRRGIYVNMNNKDSPLRVADIIVHEALAAAGFDHFVAHKGEGARRDNTTALTAVAKLISERDLPKNRKLVFEMGKDEAAEAKRDLRKEILRRNRFSKCNGCCPGKQLCLLDFLRGRMKRFRSKAGIPYKRRLPMPASISKERPLKPFHPKISIWLP